MENKPVDQNEERLAQAARNVGRTLLSANETKREATRLLLEGWRMLSDTCPITEYPLFEKKKTGEIWSVRLQMPIVKQSSSDASVEVNSARPHKEIPKEGSSPVLSTDQLSKVIGEKLMMNWEMLNEQVDGCPILKDPTGRKWLPSIMDYLDAESANQDGKLNETNLNRKAQQGLESNGPSSVGVDADDEDTISERLGEKLLLGWEMSDENCASGKCPLMREPGTGRKWSAALDQFVDEVHHNGIEAATKHVLDALPSHRPEITPGNSVDSLHETMVLILELKILGWGRQLAEEQDLIRCQALIEIIAQTVDLRKKFCS